MSDPYSIDPDRTRSVPPQARSGGRALRVLLWGLLAVSIAVNVAASLAAGDGVSFLGLGAGVVAIGCVTGLVLQHFGRRRP
ncbi:hypothetical protein [Nonomuraea sp. NPDC050643]|uniref:hypothetical protein n=1 Tax=Nonomuraea sp. NPDC050643 TaxID=3155660 RepID=UPI0033C9A169